MRKACCSLAPLVFLLSLMQARIKLHLPRLTMRIVGSHILALALLVFPAGIAAARRVNIMSYQAMFDNSDLVVIAKVISTQDTSERPISPNNTVGVSTSFAVTVVMKGDTGLTNIVLHHYRFAKSIEEALMDAPDVPELVSFAGEKDKSWLLFLAKEGDGRFAPINGQIDPGACSISAADRIDLVVIAKPVSAKNPVNGDRITWTGLPPVYLAGYQTEFAVQNVLKGDKSAKKFTLHHYEHTETPPNQGYRDVQFIDFKPEPEQSYVLILNKEADGLFRPIPGDYSKTTPSGFPVIKLGSASH